MTVKSMRNGKAVIFVAACLASSTVWGSVPAGASNESSAPVFGEGPAHTRAPSILVQDDRFRVDLPRDFEAVAVQKDGRILMLQDPESSVVSERAGLVRLNADGSLDSSFVPQVFGGVWRAAAEPDGDIILRGEFSFSPNGVVRNLGRLNADGTPDLGFRPPSWHSAGAWVDSIWPLDSGKYLVTGRGLVKNPDVELIRLNQDGSIDRSFGPVVTGRLGGYTVLPDGRLLLADVGGFGKSDRYGLVRTTPDGRLDRSFTFNSNAYHWIVGVGDDGSVYLDGTHQLPNEKRRTGLVRLRVDGTIDESFRPPRANRQIWGAIEERSGRLLIYGWFRKLDGTAQPGLARLDSSGRLDRSFSSQIGTVEWVAKTPGGTFLVGSKQLGLIQARYR